MVVLRVRPARAVHVDHAAVPYLRRERAEAGAAMRAGCTVLALFGAMYAATGTFIGPSDVALGLTATAIGLGGLVFAKWREQR